MQPSFTVSPAMSVCQDFQRQASSVMNVLLNSSKVFALSSLCHASKGFVRSGALNFMSVLLLLLFCFVLE